MPDRPPIFLIAGASSGIGKATAHLFAIEGFRNFGASRSHREDYFGVEKLEMDVGFGESVHTCMNEISSQAGHIDFLINNAGVWQVSLAMVLTGENITSDFVLDRFFRGGHAAEKKPVRFP